MSNREEDKVLARRILAGDKRAFRKFYKQRRPQLMAYVVGRVRTREDAEEIVQDAFLGFLDSLPLFSFRSALWTFLVSIARHEIADYYRRMSAKKALHYVPFMDQVYSEPLHSGEETRALFEQALSRVLPEQRKLILWKYEERLSVVEIARRLGVGVKAAESRLFRARKSFQVAYGEVSS